MKGRSLENTFIFTGLKEVRRTCSSPLFPHGYTQNFTSLMNVNFDSVDSRRRGQSQVVSTFLTHFFCWYLNSVIFLCSFYSSLQYRKTRLGLAVRDEYKYVHKDTFYIRALRL